MVIHQSKWKALWVRSDSGIKSFFLLPCRLCTLPQPLCISYSISWYDNAIMLLLKTCARAWRFLTYAAAVAKEPTVPPSPSSWTAASCVCQGTGDSVSQFTFPLRFLSSPPRCWSKTVFVETSQPSLASAASIGTQTGSCSEFRLKGSLSFYEGALIFCLKGSHGKSLWK